MNTLMRSVSNFVKPSVSKSANAQTENALRPIPVIPTQNVAPLIDVTYELIRDTRPNPLVVSQNILDVIGRDNENLRNKCVEIVRKVEEAASLQRDLGAVFLQIDVILADLERTKSELIQRTSSLAAERDAHLQIKHIHRETFEAFEKFKADAAVVAAEHKRLAHAVAELEINLGALQLKHAEKLTHNAEMQRQIAGDAEKIHEFSRDQQNANAELQRSDALIVALQGDCATQRDRAVLAEEDSRSLQIAIAETRQTASKLGRSLDETAAGHDKARKQIVDLENALAMEKAEHGKFHALWQQESEGRRTDVTAMQIKIEAQISRIEASDRLLAAARNQFHAKVEELRKEERRAQDAGAAAAALEQKTRAVDGQNAELRTKLAEVEKARDAALERAAQHLKSVMAKENAIQQGERKLQMVSDRAAADNQRFDSQRDQFEHRIQILSEMLEKEKLARALAQGALDVARKDRARPVPAVAPASAMPERTPAAATDADFAEHATEAREKIASLAQSENAKRQRGNGGEQELKH